jgi:hypothetical protein
MLFELGDHIDVQVDGHKVSTGFVIPRADVARGICSFPNSMQNQIPRYARNDKSP